MKHTTLSREYLTSLNASNQCIDFVIRNKLEKLPLSSLNFIKGLDYLPSFLSFDLMSPLNSDKVECDDKGNVIYRACEDFSIFNYQYDDNNNLIESSDCYGNKEFRYYENNNLVKVKGLYEEYNFSYNYYESGQLKAITKDDNTILEIPEI